MGVLILTAQVALIVAIRFVARCNCIGGANTRSCYGDDVISSDGTCQYYHRNSVIDQNDMDDDDFGSYASASSTAVGAAVGSYGSGWLWWAWGGGWYVFGAGVGCLCISITLALGFLVTVVVLPLTWLWVCYKNRLLEPIHKVFTYLEGLFDVRCPPVRASSVSASSSCNSIIRLTKSNGEESAASEPSCFLESAVEQKKANDGSPEHESTKLFSDSPQSGKHQDAQREHVLDELLVSEHKYVEYLSVLNEFYFEPLTALAQDPDTTLITQASINTIFGNACIILAYHKVLLENLNQWDSSGRETSTLCGIFLKLADFFKSYITYVNNYPTALAALREQEKSNEQFIAFMQEAFERAKMSKPESNVHIASLLIMPIQRIPRYVLLLKELLKLTPPTDKDLAKLVEALHKVETVAQHLNTRKQHAENLEKLYKLQLQFTGSLTKQLVNEPSRQYVWEGEVFQIDTHNALASRTLFIFTDCFLIAKNFGDHYKVTALAYFQSVISITTESNTLSVCVDLNDEAVEHINIYTSNTTDQLAADSPCFCALKAEYDNFLERMTSFKEKRRTL
ncbi:rho guanine nucleotide exchange factor 39 [Pelomyxa schiedti]|nr:rho guanine nucleotide exchange factor 39 [Pelomyxa schiedti]